MGGINYSPDRADVNESSYISGALSVTISQIEAKVGASRLPFRQVLTIFNAGNKTIYYGPSGVTSANGVPIFSQQAINIPIGDLAVFLIASSGTQSVVIQEFA
jgi:hypothetical protein